VSWVARPLEQLDASTWEANILQVWGDERVIPHRRVRIQVPRSYVTTATSRMTITFTDGAPDVTRTLNFASSYFREVTFEFDTVEGAPRVTSVDTCAHDDRPAFLRCENLTFQAVYDRAGVNVLQSRNRSTVPLALAGGDQAWQDAELQAAIRTYFSRYADAPDWVVWTLFAGTGRTSTVAGSMFDDSDSNQRQGIAIFGNAQEQPQVAPRDLPQRAEFIHRDRFFALIHEAGHCFNLHHAWLYYNAELLWPFFDNAENFATIMNYPNRVTDFYRRFRYSFHDSELRFLRHAPDRLVEMGDERFHHGEDELGRDQLSASPWTLSLELTRSQGVFEFLEPVFLTVSLMNSGRHPQTIDASVLDDAGNFALLIARRDGTSARLW